MRHRFAAASLFLAAALIAPRAALARPAAAPARPDDARVAAVDAYARKALADWKVPGASIAIVKDGRVVLARGYGVREAGKPEPVDEKTLFAIASNSKAFTSAALAILVDEKKIAWDDPVTKYLPTFQMYDSYVTREMTVRDLVSHRSGLATFGGDLLWFGTNYEADEVVRRIRYLRPTSSFRSRYGYQNVMFVAAGQVVARVSGKSWDAFVRERFIEPLGMTRTTTSIADFARLGNVAAPHNQRLDDANVRVVRYSDMSGAGAAAGLNSSAEDLIKWVRMQLGRGEIDGKRYFSAASSREMWVPHTVVPIGERAEKFNPTRHFSAYGLGWFLSDYHGRKVVNHGGGLDGMISQVAMMPEENLGVVVLTNSETPLATIMVNKIFDTYLGVPERDWSADYLKQAAEGHVAALAEAKKVMDSRVADTRPSLALAKYAGTYRGDLYGDVTVAEEGGKLVLRLGPAKDFVADLEHWHYDTFRVTWRPTVSYPFETGFVTFELDAKGDPAELKIDVPNPDFDFKELELRRVVAAAAGA